MTLINGTPMTPALQRDLAEAHIETTESHNAKLTGKITENVPCPFPFPPPSPLSIAQAELKKAEEVLGELKMAGVEVDPDATVAVKESVNTDAGEVTVVDLAAVKALIVRSATEVFEGSTLARDPDLREFKRQVIQAFKHLGLDTKQYFGV